MLLVYGPGGDFIKLISYLITAKKLDFNLGSYFFPLLVAAKALCQNHQSSSEQKVKKTDWKERRT